MSCGSANTLQERAVAPIVTGGLAYVIVLLCMPGSQVQDRSFGLQKKPWVVPTQCRLAKPRAGCKVEPLQTPLLLVFMTSGTVYMYRPIGNVATFFFFILQVSQHITRCFL